MAALRTLAARLADNRGAELVEFAITYPLLLLTVLGIMDFGLLFQQYEVITNAAREGARVAVIADYYSAADAQARAQQYLDASLIRFPMPGPAPTVTVGPASCVPSGSSGMTVVPVRVTYPHQYLFIGGIGSYFGKSFGTRTLTATATMRTEANAASCP